MRELKKRLIILSPLICNKKAAPDDAAISIF